MYQKNRIQDGYLDGGNGALYFMIEGGIFGMIHDFGNPVVWVASDPTDPETMYASVVHATEGGIYVTHDLSKEIFSTWTRLKDPPRTNGHPYNIQVLKNGDIVATYSAHTNDMLTHFYPRSGVFYSSDGGASWLDRSDSAMIFWTKDLTIDPSDSTQSTWYVGVFNGWGNAPDSVGGLYRTKDKGLTWIRILDLYGGYSVEGCSIDPLNASRMYVCTGELGLYYSDNANSVSPIFQFVPECEMDHPLRVFFDPYTNKEWVVSYGDGIMTSDLNVTLKSQPILRSEYGFLFYPNPTDNLLYSKFRQTVQIYNVYGRLIFNGIIPEDGLDISKWKPGIYFSSQGLINKM